MGHSSHPGLGGHVSKVVHAKEGKNRKKRFPGKGNDRHQKSVMDKESVERAFGVQSKRGTLTGAHA